jgi:hypothetical protein
MSPPKKPVSEKLMRSTACEWLSANVDSITEAIIARTFAEHPDLQRKYGERGRKKM